MNASPMGWKPLYAGEAKLTRKGRAKGTQTRQVKAMLRRLGY